MPFIAIPAKRRPFCSIVLVVASWAALVLGAATEEHSHSCPFSSPALSYDDHHHYDHGHHHHPHEHDHDHDHDHGEIQSRKLPEELAEEEDLAREGFGFHHHHHHHHHHFHSNDGHEHETSPLGIWVRALGCSLLVSMASLICLIILPLIFFHGKPSRAVVDCLAVFGAGAMLGDAFLHQLPHAFGGKHSHSHDDHVGSFGDVDHAHGHSHAHSLEDLSVGLSILLGIVLFFLVEKIVRYVEDHSANGSNDLTHGRHHHHQHHKQKQKLKHDGEDTYQQLSDSKNRKTLDLTLEKELNCQSDAMLKNDEHEKPEILHKRTTVDGVTSEDEKDIDSRHVQGIQKQPSLNETVPVHTSSNLVFGYLNLFSDGVHNFTDGMALGSAFLLHGSVGGWSRTLFLLAHELPQEVGDFGILVRSGFSASKALFFNFLSALVALVGTALALVLGKDPGQSSLIEGFTAGGFIYIAVAGVLPEMHDGKTTIRSTLIQLTSLLSGMAVALCISLIE